MLFGFLNINKPKGMTSHDVVSKLRRVCKIKQIGHSGTLDPLATGVLPVAVGKASRLLEYLDEDKSYIAEVTFGCVSDTYDTEGKVKKISDVKISEDLVKTALKNFEGETEQTPPAFSAVHYNGKRLYELAREGIVPDNIPKRKIFVSKINLLDFDYDSQTAKIEIDCSKGTYIRSIVNDLGAGLQTGAVMSGLVRTKSGQFSIEDSVPLDALLDSSDAEKYLINPIDVLSYKCHELSEFELQKIRHGQYLSESSYDDKEKVILVYKGQLCAVCTKDSVNNRLITTKVFVS